jgi:hypothetical protein
MRAHRRVAARGIRAGHTMVYSSAPLLLDLLHSAACPCLLSGLQGVNQRIVLFILLYAYSSALYFCLHPSQQPVGQTA